MDRVRGLDNIIEDYTRVPKVSNAFQAVLKVPAKSERHPKLQKMKIGQAEQDSTESKIHSVELA